MQVRVAAAHLVMLGCAVLGSGCSSLAVEPQPTIPARVPASAIHKVHLLPTMDARPSNRVGAGIDVFGGPDTLIHSDADLAAHLHRLLAGRMAERGLDVVVDAETRPSIQLELRTIVLRREPGVVSAHYSGTVDLVVRMQSDERVRERQVVGSSQRESSGLRALEQTVFNELLTDTLDAGARTAAEEMVRMIGDVPPQELGP